MLGAAEGCWKDQGGKVCYALAYSMPAAQTYLGIHDFLNYKPKEKPNETHVDLSRVILLPRH